MKSHKHLCVFSEIDFMWKAQKKKEKKNQNTRCLDVEIMWYLLYFANLEGEENICKSS